MLVDTSSKNDPIQYLCAGQREHAAYMSKLYSHSLFWQNLAPASSPEANSSAAPELVKQIKATWGDEDKFKEAFNAALLSIQGSGWGWLVKIEAGKEQRLTIVTTKDQDPIVGKGEVPVFGVDMWEHAYYLQVCSAVARAEYHMDAG